MRQIFQVTLIALLTLSASTAMARDTRHQFPVENVIANNSDRLDGVDFYFGTDNHPAVASTHGEYQSNKKTNAFGKSDQEACEWAFLSALVSLHQRALNEGGNAVINIRSYYKKNNFDSETEFECGAGAIMAGVTLKGTVATIE